MKQIDSLDFLMYLAVMQFCNGGVGGMVSVKMIQDNSGLPRSTVYHHINGLIERGYIKRRKRGQYCINFNKFTAQFAGCVLTVWDAIEINHNTDSWKEKFEVGR